MEETRANAKKPAPPSAVKAAPVKNRAEVMARVQWVIGIAITLVMMVLWSTGMTQRLEFPLVDEYMRRCFSAAPKPSEDLVIIAIDDESLTNTKRWPWPRDMQARVIDELNRAGAKVIALDLLLNNPEPGPRFENLPSVTRQQNRIGMAPLTRSPGFVGPPTRQESEFSDAMPVSEVLPDSIFAESIARHGRVILGAEFKFPSSETGGKPDKMPEVDGTARASFGTVYNRVREHPECKLDDIRDLLPASERDYSSGTSIEELDRNLRNAKELLSRRDRQSVPVPDTGAGWLVCKNPELPAPDIFKAGHLVGSVTATGINDGDGTLRRMPLWTRQDDRLFPTLGLVAAAEFLEVPIPSIRIEGNETVIPTRNGDVRLEMHSADLGGHAESGGLVYLAWPTGKGWIRQFSGRKHDPRPQAAIGARSPDNAASDSMTSKSKVPLPGDEISIGSVYEPALVERRIKQNIEETDRAVLGMEVETIDPISGERKIQGISLLDFDVPKRRFIDQSNFIIRMPMDSAGWLEAVESHLKDIESLRALAKDFITVLEEAEQKALKGADKPLEEKDEKDLANCRAFVKASAGVDQQVRVGLEKVEERRAMLRGFLNDKLCLIGWTAVGSIADFVPTSIDVKTPGPYVHACIANSILTNHQKLISAPWVTAVGLVSILVMGVFGTVLGVRIGVLVSPLALLVGMAVWAVFAGYVIFDLRNSVTAFATPIATAGVTWLGVTLHRLLVEQRGRKQTEARFRAYVSPDVVDILVNNPDLQSMEPQKRELTIMFSDVANWTTLTERLGTEGIFKFLSAYLGEMTDIIQKNKATLDKYLGDGIMAFWGAPVEDPDHAKNAAKACVEMLDRLDEMNRNNEFGDAGSIEVRFGIATGEVNVGDFGNPPHKSAYTVIGDAVNLSARLESSNKQFGTSILMTKRVVDLSGSTLLFRPIGRIVVKGKTEYEELYELIGDRKPKGDRTAEWIKATNDAVAAYQAGQLDDAERLFSTLHDSFGDTKLAKLYLHGIEDLRASGIPDGWEGTLVLTEK